MDVFEPYLASIDNVEHRSELASVLEWILLTYPQLEPRIAWNQPMFTAHGTFILGLSASTNHFSVSPERAGMIRFVEEIKQSGYSQSKMLFRIPFGSEVDYPLLSRIIEFNLDDKAAMTTFWRH